MASFLPSNGRISFHFGNIHHKFSTSAYFEVCVHSILSKYENSKIYFSDIFTYELYCTYYFDDAVRKCIARSRLFQYAGECLLGRALILGHRHL